MKVTVKLFGALGQFLPPGSGFNSCQLNLADDARLDELLAMLSIPPQRKYLVIINDEKINRQDYAATAIGSDDEVVLLPPIKGG